MLFRPCIDIHDGDVKQIVGATLSDAPLSDGETSSLVTNFESKKPASFYANMYKVSPPPPAPAASLPGFARRRD